MVRFFSFIKFFVIISFVTACSTPPAPPIAEINFTKYPVIKLDVSKIEVVEAYQPTFTAPNVEHTMPYSPADGMQLWVKDRLRAVGSENIMQITIIDAPVIETELPKTKGITGLFTVDQDKKYDARLEVEMRIYAGGALSQADTTVSITRSITIPENSSVNSRKQAYTKMIQEMMNMMNDKLEENIQNYMKNYIVY